MKKGIITDQLTSAWLLVQMPVDSSARLTAMQLVWALDRHWSRKSLVGADILPLSALQKTQDSWYGVTQCHVVLVHLCLDNVVGIKTYLMLWGIKFNRGKWKASSHQESNPGFLPWATSALPLSYDNWTTTSPHNPPLYCTSGIHWLISLAPTPSPVACSTVKRESACTFPHVSDITGRKTTERL